MTGSQVCLLLVGAGFELLGIGLAVLESLDVRRAFRQRSAVAHSRTASASVTGHGAVVSVTGREPTVEERIETVEQELTQLRDEVSGIGAKLRDEWREDLRIEAQTIRTEVDHHVSDLRRLLGAGVEPNRRRTVGFGLFAFGLVLQTAAQFRW